MLTREKLLEKLKKTVLKTQIIIEAFEDVDRADFVLPEHKKNAYIDEPLPILAEQTISQPTTVAIMTEILKPAIGMKILEVGTGSGYQTAILAEVVGKKGKIYTLERIPELFEFAKKNLEEYENIENFYGNGVDGFPSWAPYDRIIVTADATEVSDYLLYQLKPEGILIIPVNGELMKIEKTEWGDKKETPMGNFSFVPLVKD